MVSPRFDTPFLWVDMFMDNSHDFKAWNPKRPKLRFSGVRFEIFTFLCRDE